MAIQTGKKLLDCHFADRHHKSLVTVVTRTEIAIAERLCHGSLRYFFTVAENTEFGFSGQHFTTPEQTAFAARNRNFIIVEHFFFEILESKCRSSFCLCHNKKVWLWKKQI